MSNPSEMSNSMENNPLIQDRSTVHMRENVSAETVELDRSGEINPQRSPLYNRFKYYSAIRTGFKQLNPVALQSFLKAPSTVADPIGYYIHPPFQRIKKPVDEDQEASSQQGEAKKQTSIMTIFTCWNTMVGSGIVSLPWTFQESGFLLGLLICIVSLIVSYRTCVLMIRVAGNDKNFFETLYKYWGKWAYYCGFISALLIFIAAVTAYFINLSSMLYYIALALGDWIIQPPTPY